MVIAPFVPWYTFPLPMALFIAVGAATLPGVLLGPPQPLAITAAFGALWIVGLLWIVTAFLTVFLVRRRTWNRALWSALANLGCGLTLLGTVLLANGLGPVEPWGYISPLAFLSLSALPASFGIAGRWLRGLDEHSGPEAERRARSRLTAIGIGYGIAFLGSVATLAVSTASAIQGLPVSHFYWQEQAIRESAAVTFAVIGIGSLTAFLALSSLVVRRWTPPSLYKMTSGRR